MAAVMSASVTTSAAANVIGLHQWVGAWSAAQSVPGPGNPLPFTGFNDQTVRSVIRTSISGDSIRIRVANTFGDRHLTIGHVTVALPETGTLQRTDVLAETIHAFPSTSRILNGLFADARRQLGPPTAH